MLNRLHDEMVKCLESQDSQKLSVSNNTQVNGHNESSTIKINGSALLNGDNVDDDEWKEVGKKNRGFVTRRVRLFFF